MKIIGRIWIPAGVFVVFFLALLNHGDIYGAFIENGRFISQSFFFYGVQIGAWASSAFLLNRLVAVFFWDGFIGGISDPAKSGRYHFIGTGQSESRSILNR